MSNTLESRLSGEALKLGKELWDLQDRYEKDAALFAREVFGMEPDAWQQKGFDAVSKHGERRVTVRSGHGVGKTGWLAVTIWWFLFTRYPQKTAVTAPSSGQLFDALWPELGSWLEKAPAWMKSMVEITGDRIRFKPDPHNSFVTAKTSRAETPEAMQGVHAPNVLLIADEASGIPDAVFEAASGSMSTDNAIMILTGNPVRSSGYFYNTHMRLPGWYRIHVSCYDAKLVSRQYIQEKEVEYGVDSNAFRIRVLGEFPLADDDAVIPMELIELAQMRDIEAGPNTPVVWGLDVARFGSNLSALAKRQGPALVERVLTWSGKDTMATTGFVLNQFRDAVNRPINIHIDAVGVGGGVYDRLREFTDPKLPVIGINVGESPAMKDKYNNLRSELWWTMREWFSSRLCSIPKDDLLVRDLAAPRYKLNSRGQTCIETKEEMVRRGVQSPDTADALMLTFAAEAGIAMHGRSASRAGQTRPKRVLKMVV